MSKMTAFWEMSAEIQQGMITFVSSSLTPFLSYCYPFRTSILFPSSSLFHSHHFKFGTTMKNTSAVLRRLLHYFNVFVTPIRSTSKSFLMIASLTRKKHCHLGYYWQLLDICECNKSRTKASRHQTGFYIKHRPILFYIG
jgi:hypothetical protein